MKPTFQPRGRPLPSSDPASRPASWLEALRQDLAFAGRMMRRQPGFAVAAVLALALRLGAPTPVFSIVDAVLWRPLPFARPNELVFIGEQRPREKRVNGPVAPADFLDWRAANRSLSAMAASTGFALTLPGDLEPQRVDALAVSSGFFETLGVMPAIGRPFRPDEEDPGKAHVAILSDGL